ncbi:MAG: prepilin-type N-terminal cleavage/methylation domain-containing protein [Candidatus Pacebacteria bacterium]|nr:prepilin-type N-terminal cleavage/methylation domain-containing protein [Candidatus Paceibacterota bacterium]
MENKKADASCRGFTFIEVMMVITIMSIMAVVAVVSLNSARSNAALESSTRQIASAIQLARSYALQGKMENGSAVCGFGVRITNANPPQYKIYYNALSGYNDCSTENGKISDSDGTKDSDYVLPNGVTFSDTSVDKHFYFTVPSADFLGSSSMELDYAGSSKIINVSSNGVVTVVN